MKTGSAIATFTLLVSGCTNAPQNAQATNIPPWDASGCGDDDYQNEKLERHPMLMGLSPEIILSAYGKPSSSEDFVVGGPGGSFYGALGKRMGGAKAANNGAPARVLTWTKSACNFSVFFVKEGALWQSVNAFEWAVGADF
jgi:hypothetical protein